MNSLKNFIIRNRHLVALTVGVTTLLLGVFIVLAVFTLDSPTTPKEPSTTKRPTANHSSEADDDTIPSNEPTSENESLIDVIDPETTEIETLPANELPYLVMVNRIMNCITVYTKDDSGQFTIPVKAIVCSTGREGHETPMGTFNTSDMFKWAVMADRSCAQYVYRFKNSYLFHSVPYLSMTKDTLETEEYNKLGSAASLGCVRMSVADAIWIYENCPVNTTVIIYDDPTTPGPLGKPESIKIPLDSPYAGWDPTDPDPNNPWHNFSAQIKAQNSTVTLTVGASIEKLLSNFSANDTCGNDISDKIIIEGNYNLNVVGKYSIKVSVTDVIGSTASIDVVVIVKSEETTTPANTTTTPANTTTTKPETTTPSGTSEGTSEGTTKDTDPTITEPESTTPSAVPDITSIE